jgi:SAM-dependent methyltransferase
MAHSEQPDLPPGAFTKQDVGDDAAFYAPPRLVTHIDEGAVAVLTACYRERLPTDARVLDLMSSWVSHLPADRDYPLVVGHGMNAQELSANTRLDRWFIQNLNQDTQLPLPDANFDAVLCCVGAQYLQQPVAVFAEVRRILRPGGQFIVSFSNRCFHTKAVAIWLSLDTPGHAALIRLYLEKAGFRGIAADVLADGRSGDPLVVVTGQA